MAAAKKKVGVKKRVGRRKHPGVTLATPVGTHWFRLIWTDPDTGKRKKETLGRELNKAQATDAARRKSEEIAERKRELARGAVRATETGLKDTLEAYFDAHPQLRPRTQVIYRAAANKLIAWGKDNKATSADALTRKKLFGFREHLINEPKRAPLTGKRVGRGTFVASAGRRSAVAINQDLRAIGTVLRYLIDRQSLSKLTTDDLKRALKQLDVERDVTEYLRAADCQRLLEAALRHDADTCISREDEQRLRAEAKRRGITRAQLQKLDQPKGTTSKYDPVAPFVAFMLLTGMRLGEAVDLTWAQVDLDALDDRGEHAGAITLKGSGVKTRKGRVVGLEVSPALRSLLAVMKLRSGGKGRLFPSRSAVTAAGKRLKDYGAPGGFTWQALRRTCGTFLTNSPGIFGAASAYRSAVQLGHSVTIAEKSYLGLARGIPKDAHDLESAMQITEQMQKVIDSVGGTREGGNVVALG